jgi:hypothetical protein
LFLLDEPLEYLHEHGHNSGATKRQNEYPTAAGNRLTNFTTISGLGRGGFGIVHQVSDPSGMVFARKTFQINQNFTPTPAQSRLTAALNIKCWATPDGAIFSSV